MRRKRMRLEKGLRGACGACRGLRGRQSAKRNGAWMKRVRLLSHEGGIKKSRLVCSLLG